MYKHKEQYLALHQAFCLTNDNGDSTSFPATFLTSSTPQELEAFSIYWEDDPVPEEPPAKTAEQLREEWKAQRAAAVEAIKVTTAAGNVFDGDEVSQGRMARAIIGLNASGDPSLTITWVLSDNTVVLVAAEELVEAMLLAGNAQSALWVEQKQEVATATPTTNIIGE